MASEQDAKVSNLSLHYNDDRLVVVTPKDEDRFVTDSAFATEACKSFLGKLQWSEGVREAIKKIHTWAAERSNDVRAVYIAAGREGLKVFVIVTGDDYRFDFDAQITALNENLFQIDPRIISDVLQLPDGSQKDGSYFSTQSAFEVYKWQPNANT